MSHASLNTGLDTSTSEILNIDKKIYNLWVSSRQAEPLIVSFQEKHIWFNNQHCRLIMLNNMTLEVQLENLETQK